MRHPLRVVLTVALLASRCGQVAPFPQQQQQGLPQQQGLGQQGLGQQGLGQQDSQGLAPLEYAPLWGWYAPTASAGSADTAAASQPDLQYTGRPSQQTSEGSSQYPGQQYTRVSPATQRASDSQYAGQQYPGVNRPAQQTSNGAPQYTGQQYPGGGLQSQRAPASGSQYPGQQYTGGNEQVQQVSGGSSQYPDQQYTSGSRPMVQQASDGASQYPVQQYAAGGRPVEQASDGAFQYPSQQYPRQPSGALATRPLSLLGPGAVTPESPWTLRTPYLNVPAGASSWPAEGQVAPAVTAAGQRAGQQAAVAQAGQQQAVPQAGQLLPPAADAGGVGAALVNLLRSKAALVGTAVRGGVRAVFWLPGVLLDALRGVSTAPASAPASSVR
ncbi:calcium-binding protein P-like [Frankliniella occidentalis]|uniref:Calcium-binding protein P-like n=1 Tax=Frankliniella occidentalis TaxID=133901 RepID=A0A9C6XAC8_FRAOC|nr:calcium-binding protein P-like [Frankliniella occidentalis]